MANSMAPSNDLQLSGYDVRPLQPAHAREVFELMAESERDAVGEVSVEEADIVADWQRPSFDLTRQSVGVFDGDRLVAYAEVYLGRWADTAVALDHRGRGIGSALAHWTQRVSRRDGHGVVGLPVPAGSAGERLMQSLGYTVAWTSWVLETAPGFAIEAQPVVEGYRIRAAADEAGYRAAHLVVDHAFREWSERDAETSDDFAAGSVLRPGFAPWQMRLVHAHDGHLAGVSLIMTNDGLGYVAKLAVQKRDRGLGLGRALLSDSHAAAREHGCTRFELSTDSRTGALGLYEKVGMTVRSTWRHWTTDTSASSS